MEESISFTCPSCGAKFKAPVTAAGRTAPCSHCQHLVSVPAVFEEPISKDPTPIPLPRVIDAPHPHGYQPPPPFHKRQNIFVQMFLLLIAVAIMAAGVGMIWFTTKNGRFPWMEAPATEAPTAPGAPGKAKPATVPAAKPATPSR